MLYLITNKRGQDKIMLSTSCCRDISSSHRVHQSYSQSKSVPFYYGEKQLIWISHKIESSRLLYGEFSSRNSRFAKKKYRYARTEKDVFKRLTPKYRFIGIEI